MKKAVIYCLFYYISIIPLYPQDKIISFVTDESPPYTINSKIKNKPQGFMIDVAREVFNKAGYQIDIRFVPYKRSIQKVYDGHANGVLLVAENSAPGLIFLKNPMSMDKVVFFAKKGTKWKYTGIESLENVRIAGGVGFDFADPDINEFIRKKSEEKSLLIQLISGEDINRRNFEKLLLGRVDVVITTEKIGKYVATEIKLINQLKIAGNSKLSIIAQTGFDPNNPRSHAYAEILSNGVLELNATGKMNAILSIYGLGK